jgi:hypothetical protein
MFNGLRDYVAGETVVISRGKIIKRYLYTNENVNELEDNEVFVFGSNMAGQHTGGAAKVAREKFGALNGVSEGMCGQSYAIPTLTKNMTKRSLVNLRKSIGKLIRSANENTTKIFLVTKIGCGIAGFSEDKMKSLFDRNDVSANIILPRGWRNDV